MKRVATALAGAPLLLVAVYLGGWPFLGVIMVLGGLSYLEFCGLVRSMGLRSLFVPGLTLIFGILFWAHTGAQPISPQLLALFILGISMVYLLGYPEIGPADIALATWGAVYLGGMLSFLVLLRQNAGGWGMIVLVLLATWATDIAAYYCGRMLGGPRIVPAVSPNKTWSGSLGGIVAAVLLVGLAGGYLTGIGLSALLGLGLVMGIAGQAGDLMESALKRHAGVKDSGSMLPGHGGFLDRFDSLLWNAPVAYLYLQVVVKG